MTVAPVAPLFLHPTQAYLALRPELQPQELLAMKMSFFNMLKSNPNHRQILMQSKPPHLFLPCLGQPIEFIRLLSGNMGGGAGECPTNCTTLRSA
mmetsp:Transcript_4672/g.7233  ORF Transcript_4672/g.7233 Transcript_4672/m.7233 type:complete len:95 (+) Transcript_4672:2513-2797(+)